MEQSFISKTKEILLNREKELRDRLKSFAKPDQHVKSDYHSEFPEYGDKEEDNAVEVAAFQDSLSLESNLEKDLRAVQKALEKIEQGKFGKCEKCGREIEKERLELSPSAETCVKCKDL